MTMTLKVYSSFTCPYSYLTQFIVNQAINGKDVHVAWLPFFLNHEEQSWQSEQDNYKEWADIIKPISKKLQVDIKMPKYNPSTYNAQIGYLIAKDNNKHDIFRQNVYEAHFITGDDISDLPVLMDIAAKSGLEKESFPAALQEERYRLRLETLKEKYNMKSMENVPHFTIGDRKCDGFVEQSALEKMIRCAIRDAKMDFCDGDSCY
ncbi:DSBA oxidoreductase [Fictibacillus macauensis ZFHKF-1]|uniref:DSBA oxidoreductase n=1 Tax=Fictibacillus macauensis ZFHKF-1 TaxID=1196324 RepID=I8UHJ5_9BACL|nr:DsbA family protein [Fictibacillus macauensis]EIT86293.1 DSBA oxidoreductase [Fictibacillus macauensis ZFHKF-1]